MKIVGCFLEYDGKFVILVRHAHKPPGNTRDMPTNKVEPEEGGTQAMIRELQEETGYHAHAAQLEHVRDYEFVSDVGEYTFFAYRMKLSEPYTLAIDDAAYSEYQWVTAKECDALPNLIPNFHEPLRFTGLLQN